MNLRLFYCILSFSFAAAALAQPARELKGGMSLSVELEKSLMRNLNLGFEGEVRLQNNNNPYFFDRNVSSVGVNYALLKGKLKAGAYYAFIYLYNNDYRYEPRHRFYFNLSYKHAIDRFSLSWRGRLQGTYRDPATGSYRVNPRYAMKNKLELEYSPWGSPWKPYLSGDVTTNLNDNVTRYDPVRLRYQAGTTWRMNRTDYLDFFLRFDQYLKSDDANVLSAGVSYKIKF